ARMLAMEAAKLGIEVHVLSARADDPAALVTRHWVQGDVSDLSALKNFFGRVDAVTLESEFLDERLILDAESATGTLLFPSVRVVGEIQDRLKQKAFLERARIPTSPY